MTNAFACRLTDPELSRAPHSGTSEASAAQLARRLKRMVRPHAAPSCRRRTSRRDEANRESYASAKCRERDEANEVPTIEVPLANAAPEDDSEQLPRQPAAAPLSEFQPSRERMSDCRRTSASSKELKEAE